MKTFALQFEERPVEPMPERLPLAWEPMLRSAGRLHGLDAEAALEFARLGVLGFDDIVVALVDRCPAPREGGNDLSIVCPLTLPGAQTQAGMLRVLRANFLLASSTGFSIGSTSDDELHLIHTTRTEDLDAGRLAALMHQCASLAAALQREFAIVLPGGGTIWSEATPSPALHGGVPS